MIYSANVLRKGRVDANNSKETERAPIMNELGLSSLFRVIIEDRQAFADLEKEEANRVSSFAAGSAPVSAIGSTALGSESPFVKLLLAVFNSILEVFLLCAAGYILARHGILDKRTQKQINRLNVSLFTPALLFSKVAFFLTPDVRVPDWACWCRKAQRAMDRAGVLTIVTLASMFVGRVWDGRSGCLILRANNVLISSHSIHFIDIHSSSLHRSFVTASAMFMNSNALPIALMQSLVLSVPDLAWGDDDNTDAMMGRALTYLTMYSTLGMVIRYSYGISLLSRADTINASLASAPFPSTSTAPSSGLGPGPAKNINYLQQGEDDEHTPLLGSTSRASSPLHTHPSSSTLYEPYTERLLFLFPSFLPILLLLSLLIATPMSTERLGINGVDVDGPAFAAAGQASPTPSQPHFRRDRSRNGRTRTPHSITPSRTRRMRVERICLSGRKVLARAPARVRGTEDEEEREEEAEEEECTATTADEAERDLEAAETGLIPPDRRKRRKRKHHRAHHHPSHPHPPSSSHLHTLHHFSHTLRHTTHRVLHTLHSVLHTLNNFMTVPLWAALASLLVACIEPVKHTLERHLTPLNDAVATCGRCAVPLTLVVLGGYFFEETGVGQEGVVGAVREEERERRREEKKKKGVWKRIKDSFVGFFSGFGKSKTSANGNANVAKATSSSSRPGESKTVVLSILARMVLTPLLLVPLILMATKGDWHAIFEDPVFVTVNTILLCSPPALTLAQITAKVSGDAFERLISRTIFWSYCVMTPPVMILCVLAGLWLAEF
ncbi:hypothetical protein CPB84DRAFT_1890792 [Gymnopilus junonius]|uniref:PIN-like protein n=1 Tax=Gymnopilus junonius TaxID=109634 RepID=A0A9P5N9T3_GYMJU|nr:hypothetical protein CPB84DRAFT_1890792 [Gymnopilus junonius]